MTDLKTGQRREARARLKQIDEAARFAASQAVATSVAALPAFQEATVALLFAPMPDEMLAPWFLWQKGKRFVLPRVERGGGDSANEPKALGLYEPPSCVPANPLTIPRGLTPGAFGILEPDPEKCPVVEPAQIDFVLVPGLGFDHSGLRLGRGGGFYDRLLARLRPDCFRCGCFYAAQAFEALAAEEHDQAAALDAVVTEADVLLFPGRGKV